MLLEKILASGAASDAIDVLETPALGQLDRIPRRQLQEAIE